MTLTLTFSPTNQNILAWAALHFEILHRCISSVLSCNQNTHCVQGPKSDYTHAYNHYLSNFLSWQLPFWSSSVFSMLHFLSFIPIQLTLGNRQHIIWTFTKMWLPSQSTLKKTQGTLHRLKLAFIFIFLWLLLSWGSLLVWLLLVGACCLTATPTLCSFVPLFATVVAFPTELPLCHAQLHRRISTLSYYTGIKIGYFCLPLWAWDYPTVANVDHNSSAACIAALRSRGF